MKGMGELHLEILVDRMKREFGVEANVGKPQVAYKETITAQAEAENKYIKQSGGKGQYGHVKITIKPLEKLEEGAKIPKNVHLKVSAHCGQANPLSGLLLQKIGANSFNPVRDLSLPAISALRSVISIPLDLHCDNPISSGGFIRNYEVPEFIRIASPVYLKIGNSVLPKHGHFTTEDDAILMVNQIKIIKEFIEDYSENISQSSCSELYESAIKTGEYLNV